MGQTRVVDEVTAVRETWAAPVSGMIGGVVVAPAAGCVSRAGNDGVWARAAPAAARREKSTATHPWAVFIETLTY
jgi:hypothetical protein